MIRNDLRNIAIIAHVDHGKTTLVDGMLQQTQVFRENEQVQERVMDSNDLERERGITILAKNTAITIEDKDGNPIKINIVDTPGHADFGGEVERVLNMVDGVLLLVDAAEGPMPQTRFVLKKALEMGHRVILVINKIDRKDARADEVLNEAFDLFIELGASEEQADFPVIYAVGLDQRAGYSEDLDDDLGPLFQVILDEVPAPDVDIDAPLQMLVTTLDYNQYKGLTAIGRIFAGTIRNGQQVARMLVDGEQTTEKVRYLSIMDGLERIEVDSAKAGDIVAIAGLDAINIGETLADPENPVALPAITVEEPTVRMAFSVNNSPFAGREGKYVTSRQVRKRLYDELKSNVAMRVEDTDAADTFLVYGRGELHLGILIETMRREGFEFAVSTPEVIYKEDENGATLEPFSTVYVEASQDYWGPVAEALGKRRGLMQTIRYADDNTVHAEYIVPVRGLLGFRQPFLTMTRGTGIFNSIFHDYLPFAGNIEKRELGSLVSMDNGPVSAYALTHLLSRGDFFIEPTQEVYAGQVVGEHLRDDELVVNVTKTKNLTGHRGVPKAIVDGLPPHRQMSLDQAIEYLHRDELLEVTPESLRIRKRQLVHHMRQKEAKKAKA